MESCGALFPKGLDEAMKVVVATPAGRNGTLACRTYQAVAHLEAAKNLLTSASNMLDVYNASRTLAW